MSNFGGYAGKFLRVDLTHEQTTDVVFDEDTLRKYIGGTGIGAKILYEEIPPEIDWSDPRNRLILASGPLGGTRIGGSGTFSLVTKGALTNGATSVQANGLFGAYMKFCGYDGVIVQGATKRWLYLDINDGKAELREANHLLGRDTYETVDLLKKDLGKKERQVSVVSIGPAGEHLVRFAGVFAEKGHSASHNGPGAVMGSKKLKAIVVSRGNQTFEVKDKDKLAKVAEELYQNVKTFTGTVGGVYWSYKSGMGTLPIKNYLTNIWDITEDEVEGFSEEFIRKTLGSKPNPCWACRLTHSTMMTITEGPYAGMVVEEPEYEQLAAWGPVINLKDIFSAIMLSGLTDRLGFENNEAGWIIGWVMECIKKGFLTKDDVNGLEMRWGNVEAVRQLLYMIAHRQGIGDLLAEGVMRASQKIGGEAAECAIYTKKGNAPRGHDHRTAWGELFDTVVSNTGTIETHRTLMNPEIGNKPGNPMETSTEVALTKGIMGFDDSLGTCRFNTRLNLVLEAEAVSAVTGWHFTPEEAKKVGLRAVNLMKAFNIRAGITRELDHPSARYGSTPVDGPSKNQSTAPHWEKMLENYYSLMGWDVETGKPLPKTLKNLGLEHVIKDLWDK
uniref:Aldehyde ferredoxin oxidoreductase n=1 Tax=uncultured marine crenarchaeote E48-1C TaxID=907718 RepID=G9BAT1_9ARCH|nr:aldehyde ferredoxin oxidoreductase [uncultured marine crenarchaeote E48-1C]